MAWSSWYNSFSDAFKKRAGRYLINRYLGTFLDETISMDQLSVDGAISLSNVALNIRTINSMIDDADLPVEFVDGYIQDLSVTIPWSNLLTESCFFSIDGLTITLQVKKRANPAQISASIFMSMCESFSSFSVAEDCIKQGDVESSPGKSRKSQSEEDMVAGVELLAQAIDSVIMRVQVRLTNTTVRLEYLPGVPGLEDQGLALQLHIGKLVYRGQAGQEEDTFSTSTLSKIYFEDVVLYTDEFKLGSRNLFKSQNFEESVYEEDTEPDPPLQLASLTGNQELILRFTELNQYGLPRAVGEVEMSLGTLKLHVFPHQVHIITEIISAITVPVKPGPAPVLSKHQKQLVQGLEGMLQDNLRFKPPVAGLNMGWGGDMDASREFKPLLKPSEAGFLTGDPEYRSKDEDSPSSPPMPRIIIRAAGLVAVVKEKDPGILKFGGEDTKPRALDLMRKSSNKFFNTQIAAPVFDGSRIGSWHTELGGQVQDSHIQVVGTPLTLMYEEGTAVGGGLTSSYAAITKLTVGKLSVVECLIECDAPEGSRHEIINLLEFSSPVAGSPRPNKNPDFKLIFKDIFSSGDNSPVSSISLNFNSCSLEIDPGFVDRTFLIFNYAEMDPDYIRTVVTPTPETDVCLQVQMNIPKVKITFLIPKPDMRSPGEIGPDFLRSFWTRKIHPELYTLEMEGFEMRIDQAGGSRSPLELNFASKTLELLYRESKDVNQFLLLQARRLVSSDPSKRNNAVEIRIKICMDDSLKLQGKFNSDQHKMQKSVFIKKESLDLDSETYFVVNPDTGSKSSTDRSNFTTQLKDIMSALNQSLLRNNLLLDIKFDAVSLVLPNKRVYEVIYNRIGNDMLLWVPSYLTVKQYIFGEKVFNPLEDDSSEFSACFSGRKQDQIEYEETEPIKNTNAFPKDLKTGPFEIHTDTAVSLSVNQVQLLICLPMESELNSQNLGILHISAIGLSLISASGLDKDPEIAIFNLKCDEGCVKYGLCKKNALPAQLHFNSEIENLEVLVTTNAYCDKAWLHKPANTGLLNLTTKVLLDRKTNLKSIQLAFNIVQGGMCVREPGNGSDWINSLVNFFTVVEFPVLGYSPPVVLTELHFLLAQCAVEFSPPSTEPGRAVLCLGKVKITCSLLDTTKDASVNIGIEDASLFVTNDSINPVQSSLCVADIDYFDIIISLCEPEKDSKELVSEKNPELTEPSDPLLNVSAKCNLVRVRTCADTLQLLINVFSGFSDSETTLSVTESASEDKSLQIESETGNILPDLEDAMAELMGPKDSKPEKEEKEELEKPRPTCGTQVFFFPDENCPILPPTSVDLMSQSIYVERKNSSDSEDFSDLESFCILEEEEGSGIVSSSGEPTIRVLDPTGVKIDENHFTVPQEGMDHLKPPRGFPLSQVKLALTKLSLVWQIFGGNDLSESKEMKCSTKAKLQKMGMSMIDETKRNRNSSKPGSSSARHISESLKTVGGPGRDQDVLIELSIFKMAAQHETYLRTEERNSPVSRQIFLIPNLEIRDRLVESEINKLLHMHSSKSRPRQSSAHMLSIKALTVHPDPSSQLEETSLKVSLQPFRINIDQDTLFFLIDFVNSFIPQEPDPTTELLSNKDLDPMDRDRSGSIKFSSGLQAIKMEVPEGTEVFEDARSSPPKLEDEEDNEPEEEDFTPSSKSSTPGPGSNPTNNIYFKSFIFSPSVPIRIDYVGKYVDLTQGALTGILAGLAQLNCSEITLRHLEFKQGILGLDKLLAMAATAWMADIRSTQLPALLGGVGPMHALLQMVTGLRDLICMPIEQYRKDGRIVRGIQRGTTSFTHSTTLSILEVTNKILNVVKFAAELAFDVMSPEGCVVKGKLPHPTQYCRRRIGRSGLRRARGAPHDMREGMLGAMALVREGFDETARSLAEAAHERTGMAGAVGGVLRAVPSTMVRPVILGAAATSNLLDGVKNQISPSQRLEEEEKWKTHS